MISSADALNHRDAVGVGSKNWNDGSNSTAYYVRGSLFHSLPTSATMASEMLTLE